MLNYEEVFKSVEDVLSLLPNYCSNNYYENKKGLLIKKFDSTSKFTMLQGNYDTLNNVITIHDMRALSHELIHMAFENRNKSKNSLYEIGNGLMIKVGNKTIGRGLTEGFCEYVNRKNKCLHIEGQELNHFFALLLINIYGEDIISYAFLNNPIAFFEDKRFKNIIEISNKLDMIDRVFKSTIGFLGMFLNVNSKINNQVVKNNEITTLVGSAMTDGIRIFIEGNIELFKLIIEEYNNCFNPLVNRNEFAAIMKSYKMDSYGSFIVNELDEKISALISEFLEPNGLKKEV